MADEWFYLIDDMQHGPFDPAYLRELLAWGKIDVGTPVWREGMEQWTAISQLPEFGGGGGQTQAPAQGPGGTGPYQLAYGGYQADGEAWPGSAYGGFWIRFLALFVDGVILAIPRGICTGIENAIDTAVGDGTPTAGLLVFAILIWLLPVFIDWFYFAGMESSSYQATFGKMACGLVVTDVNGRRLGFGRATGRYFAKAISWLTLAIGFIMAGFDPKKRALHDRIAGTYVVKKNMVRRRR